MLPCIFYESHHIQKFFTLFDFQVIFYLCFRRRYLHHFLQKITKYNFATLLWIFLLHFNFKIKFHFFHINLTFNNQLSKLTAWLTACMPDWLTESLTHWLNDWLHNRLKYCLTDWLIDSLLGELSDYLNDCLTD